MRGDQHVGGFDVAVDDALLMGMLHGLTDREKQLQPLPGRETVGIAVVGDGHALDQLHDEVRPAAAGLAAIVDLGDVRMIHEGQGLPFGLEASDDLAGIHTRLDDLEGDFAAHRALLLGDEDQPHAAFADLLYELVGTDDRAGTFGNGLVACDVLFLGPAQESARILIEPAATPRPVAQGRVGSACLFEKAHEFVGALAVQGFEKDRLGIALCLAHGWSPIMAHYSMPRFRRNPPKNGRIDSQSAFGPAS